MENVQPTKTSEISPPKRVLLAEDDAAVRKLLQILLERAGYRVFTAEDGLQAMNAANSNEFDVAVLDAIMPNMSGYDLCRIFRSHPVWQNIPIVILTGLAPDSKTEADFFLSKTANFQTELLEILSRLFSAEKP